MQRIKFLVKKAWSWNYKDAYEQATKIKNKRGGSAIKIFFDMIACGIKYGAGYCDYVEFEFDLLSHKQRATYLTSELNNRIVRKYNDKNYRHLFQNKIEFNKIFKEYLKRDFISLKEATEKDFIEFFKKYKKICAKPVDQSCGEGIIFLEYKQNLNFKEIYQSLRRNKQYLIEEYIKQHHDLNRLYPKSVNSLRIISFLDDNNEIQIIRTIIKFGTTGDIDNHVAGGMYTFIDEKGVVLYPAADDFGNAYEKHPVTNVNIVGFRIPYYQEALELIKKAGKIIPQIRYVGWDVAISETGPLIIEGNDYCGLFQNKASLNPTKEGDLHLFKKYMKF